MLYSFNFLARLVSNNTWNWKSWKIKPFLRDRSCSSLFRNKTQNTDIINLNESRSFKAFGKTVLKIFWPAWRSFVGLCSFWYIACFALNLIPISPRFHGLKVWAMKSDLSVFETLPCSQDKKNVYWKPEFHKAFVVFWKKLSKGSLSFPDFNTLWIENC